MASSKSRGLPNSGPSALSILLLLAVVCGHVFLSPYAKIEEIFSLHAVHDILRYGFSSEQFVKVHDLSALATTSLFSVVFDSLITLFILILFRARLSARSG